VLTSIEIVVQMTQGLKPAFSLTFYAALKRRAFTASMHYFSTPKSCPTQNHVQAVFFRQLFL
jgi:hypothetical protein